jgi:PAS domain S-box-containing protein
MSNSASPDTLMLWQQLRDKHVACRQTQQWLHQLQENWHHAVEMHTQRSLPVEPVSVGHESQDAQLMRAIFQRAYDAIMVLNAQGRIELFNHAAEQMFGYTYDDVLGLRIGLLVPELFGDEQDGYVDEIQACDPETGKVWETTALRRDGQEFLVELALSEVTLPQRKAFVLMLRDITERRSAQAQLLHTSRMASVGETLKMVSHQWRQPLSSITTIVSNLLLRQKMGTVCPTRLESDLQKVLNHAQGLAQTLKDFRDFAEKPIQPIRTTPKGLLEGLLRNVEASLQDACVTISVELGEFAHREVQTFPQDCIQVLLRLLHNAEEALVARDIADRRIWMRASEHNGFLSLSIEDNAGGIEAEHLPHVFLPYFTTKKQLNRAGIGLYTARAVAERNLQGSLEVQNGEHGACFTLNLPKSLDLELRSTISSTAHPQHS